MTFSQQILSFESDFSYLNKLSTKSRKTNISYAPDTHTYVCVKGGKKR